MNKKSQLLAFMLLTLSSIYSGFSKQQKSQFRTYHLDKRSLNKNETFTTLELDHQHGNQLPKDLKIEIHEWNGSLRYAEIDEYDNKSLKSYFSMGKQKIRKILLHSQQKLNLKSKGRVLLQIENSQGYLSIISMVLGNFFSAARNLVIIGLISNSLDFWMPLLMFIECFLAYGMWTHDPHLIGDMLEITFSSKIDVFNFIRSILTTQSTQINITVLQRYGFTNNYFLNMSGQYLVLIIFFIATAIIKVSNIFVKNQRLRSIHSKLRSIWNGYVFWLIPRSLTFAGYQFRSLPDQVLTADIVNCVIASLVIIGFIVFTVFLIIQVKKINSKLEYIEDSRLQIGLVKRIDYMRDFQFDCLQYSLLYYPTMNTIRMLIGFLCSGFAPDFHYVQFGGPIACQIFYMMIQISCSGYTRLRDKIIYPITRFFFVVYILAYITIGLVNQVGYLELTLQLEILAFTMVIAILVLIIGSLIADAIQQFRIPSNVSESSMFMSKSEKQIIRNNLDSKQCKAEDLSENKEDQSENSTFYSKGNKTNQNKMKVMKIRKGKVI